MVYEEGTSVCPSLATSYATLTKLTIGKKHFLVFRIRGLNKRSKMLNHHKIILLFTIYLQFLLKLLGQFQHLRLLKTFIKFP